MPNVELDRIRTAYCCHGWSVRQFSCGKGHATGWLAQQHKDQQVVAVRVGGSNAGHTTYDRHGQKWSLRHIPVTAVTNPAALLVLAAGSEIDLEVLRDEVDKLQQAGHRIATRLLIDRAAVIVHDKHKLQESAAGLTVNSGNSTGKGVGAARADRAMRKAKLAQDDAAFNDWAELLNVPLIDTGRFLNGMASRTRGTNMHPEPHVMIEGIQGHGLSVYNADAYPKVTSAGTDAVDLLAMARINPWAGWRKTGTVVVMRTRPIRIAGDSGPLANETTWEALGVEPEITTVTHRVRRVGEWDPELAANAIDFNGGPDTRIWLSMVDQMFPQDAGVTETAELSDEAVAFIRQVERDSDALVGWLGTGPNTVCVWRP